MQTTILGEKEFVLGLRFEAYPTGQELADLLVKAVEHIGMAPFGEPVVREFPTPEGFGGEGELHYQAIGAPTEVFLMLHESGVMGNTYIWKDKWGRVHKCTRILLSSCLPFGVKKLGKFLSEKLGPVVEKGFFVY